MDAVQKQTLTPELGVAVQDAVRRLGVQGGRGSRQDGRRSAVRCAQAPVRLTQERPCPVERPLGRDQTAATIVTMARATAPDSTSGRGRVCCFGGVDTCARATPSRRSLSVLHWRPERVPACRWCGGRRARRTPAETRTADAAGRAAARLRQHAGEPQRPDGVMRDVFRDACTALKLRGQTGRAFTPHCLRDSFATGHLMARKDVGWVAMMLGARQRGDDACATTTSGSGRRRTTRSRTRPTEARVRWRRGDSLGGHRTNQ